MWMCVYMYEQILQLYPDERSKKLLPFLLAVSMVKTSIAGAFSTAWTRKTSLALDPAETSDAHTPQVLV